MPDFLYPDVAVNIYKPQNPVEVPVVENKIATLQKSPNIIRHITLDVSGTELEGKIRSGQSIGVIPEGVNEHDGKPPKVRLYSISSPSKGEDGEGKILSITVKRVIEEDAETANLFLGLCSNYLSNLNPGDTVKVTGPSGKRFVLPENAADFNYLFFATGTGIAPFRGMMGDLMEIGVERDKVLVFGSPYTTDLLYYNYFKELADQYGHFHYFTAISREGRRPDGKKNYIPYKISDARDLFGPILEQENTLIYVCGMKGMELGIYEQLAREGFTEYLRLSDEVAGKSPQDWTHEDLKKRVKPSGRMFLEVY